MVDILCLGEPLFELSQIDATLWRQGVGGDISNVATAVARQGVSVGVISRLGNDLFAKAIRAQWASDGVDDSAVVTVPDGKTGIYFIRHTEQGHVFDYCRNQSAARGLAPADLPQMGCKILHVSGITMAISETSAATALVAIERARQAGALVSYDPNLRLNLTSLEAARAVQQAVFQAGCDIALPGLEDAQVLTGLTTPEEIGAFYLQLGARYVALTLGPEGAMIFTEESAERVPPRPAKLLDASGAGDCFDGAFLAMLAKGKAPFEACKYAVAASSLSVAGFGASTSIPDAEVVLACLDKF